MKLLNTKYHNADVTDKGLKAMVIPVKTGIYIYEAGEGIDPYCFSFNFITHKWKTTTRSENK